MTSSFYIAGYLTTYIIYTYIFCYITYTKVIESSKYFNIEALFQLVNSKYSPNEGNLLFSFYGCSSSEIFRKLLDPYFYHNQLDLQHSKLLLLLILIIIIIIIIIIIYHLLTFFWERMDGINTNYLTLSIYIF